MKKYAILLSAVLLLNAQMVSQAFALTTSTKSATPTVSSENETSSDSSSIINKLKQIEKLKDKIATKVAELREKDKTGISGTVKKIENSTITLTTGEGEKKISYSDDIVVYQFTKDGRTEQKISKMKEGNYISVIGIFNEDKSAILGKIIYIEDENITFFGKIVDIDRDNYTVTVKTKDASELVDIETTTRIFTYNTTSKKIEKGGFSKIVAGDPIHVVGTARLKESNKVTGGKLYVFPQFNQNAETLPTASASATPALSKGVKPSVTPKISPTPTKKLISSPTPTKKLSASPTP